MLWTSRLYSRRHHIQYLWSQNSYFTLLHHYLSEFCLIFLVGRSVFHWLVEIWCLVFSWVPYPGVLWEDSLLFALHSSFSLLYRYLRLWWALSGWPKNQTLFSCFLLQVFQLDQFFGSGYFHHWCCCLIWWFWGPGFYYQPRCKLCPCTPE